VWNAVVALIWGIIAVQRNTLTEMFGIGIPLMLIGVKFASAQIVLNYLPHLEHDKDLLSSRVDMMRDDELSPRLSFIQNLND